MDKLVKYLRTLPPKIRQMLEKEMLEILAGKLEEKDIKALTGYKNYFRVRKGNFRIIFRRSGDKIFIVKVLPRDDRTYRGL